MAANKTTSTSSAKRKPAAKRPASAASPRGGKRPAGKSAATHMTADSIRQKNQRRAVILFACAVFLACLVFIPGDNLWNWAHNVMLGLFGGWAVLWPLLMIYIAIVTTLDKPRGSIGGKIWMTGLVILLFCATGFIFGGTAVPANLDFGQFMTHLYTENNGAGGGVIGGITGLPLLQAAGDVGAKIIILLLLFVGLMLLTGTTLIGLFRTIKKPVDVVSEGLQTAKQRREEERFILENAPRDIDVPLADMLPAHPVRSDPAALFPAPKPQNSKKQKEPSEKLDKLKEVFGFTGEEAPPTQSKEAQIQEKINAETIALENAVKEIGEIKIPVAGVDTVTSPPEAPAVQPIPQPIFLGEKLKDIPAEPKKEGDPAAAEDAKQLADEFMKKRMENEKMETTVPRGQLPQGEPTSTAYSFPPVSMLAAGKQANPALETEELQTNGRVLVETLKSFGVQTKILDICRGPAVTRYELQPAAGVKISKITNLADDLAMNLAATGVRIEAPIPGKAAVGIEVPNKTKSIVRMRELVESNSFVTAKSRLAVALGRDIAGQVTVADLGKMPHVLIAGTTGSGKSVCINSLIISLLYKSTPDEVRLLMIDPKVVELGIYNGIPHLLVPVVTDPRKAAGALNWAVTEMLKRYKIFAENNVRDLEGYNSLAAANHFQDENGQPMLKMPQIVIIIDELSDLMMAAPNEVEDSICRLAQMARAAGMHLVVATQRPSVDVVTGLIKANIPSRIAFAVSSAIDSRTILDTGGAEKLLGQGDMLFAPVGAQKPLRVQGCFVSDGEIESIVEFAKKSKVMEYDTNVIDEIEKNALAEGGKSSDNQDGEDGDNDPMVNEAIKCVVEAGQASTSLLQRRLRLGYARAGRLIDDMEQMGIVGPHEGSKPRQVLMTYAQWLEMNMRKPDENSAEE